MEVDEAREFLRENHRAVLATFRQSGDVQLSPVTVGVDEEGKAVISTRETAMKTRNLRRHPRAYLCVMNDAFFGPWLRVDGTAEIVELPEAMDLLVDYYRRIAGEHPDWDEYREVMEKERRVLLRISLDTVGPDRSG